MTYRRVTQLIGSRLFLDVSRDTGKSILVAGTARSGTTWLAELIASQLPCRMMFEPFHPELVAEYRSYHYFQYMRPGDDEEVLHAFARKVFSGEIRNRWIDRKNETILPHWRVVKEIRGNLLLKWLHDRFPEVPLLFLIRHPCAVVLSRMELGWATDRDIAPFLAQPKLIADHLGDYVEFIQKAGSDEEKHAIIWCVSNLVPLKQFQPGELKPVYYEDLCEEPEKTLCAVMQAIERGDRRLHSLKADRPSSTCSPSSSVMRGEDKISRWKEVLPAQQISRIMKVVSEFGMDVLYDESPFSLNSW